jgi:hypothetical protein
MKKYKLIKTYPGSPLLGKVLEPKVEKDNEDTNNFYWEGSWFNPNDFPELWEEVDYEVVDTIVKNNLKLKISSVKRLSDGEIFSVGDKFTGYSSEGNTIRRFELLGNTLFIHTTNQGTISNTPGIGLFKSIKKVVENDYEIISYWSPRIGDSKYLYYEGHEDWDNINKSKYHPIHSVKRLSDGEVFTIGDKIKVSKYGNPHIISKFSLTNDNSSIMNGIWINYDGGSSHIINAIKIKTKVDMNNAELEFMFFMKGTSGSFKTNLFKTIMSADNTNQKKLSLGFPDEVEVVRRYQQEDGYWQELLEKQDNGKF